MAPDAVSFEANVEIPFKPFAALKPNSPVGAPWPTWQPLYSNLAARLTAGAGCDIVGQGRFCPASRRLDHVIIERDVKGTTPRRRSQKAGAAGGGKVPQAGLERAEIPGRGIGEPCSVVFGAPNLALRGVGGPGQAGVSRRSGKELDISSLSSEKRVWRSSVSLDKRRCQVRSRREGVKTIRNPSSVSLGTAACQPDRPKVGWKSHSSRSRH